MDKDRLPMAVVAVLFEWKVCTGLVARVEREGMYNELYSIHSTPRWLASDEDLGPPSFPIWQFRSDDGGALEIT